jgi:hypothetical protein
MLLKAVGKPLGIATRVQESYWEMFKGYLKTSGQILKGIGKPLGNAQIRPSASKKEGRVAQRILAKTWQFLFISYEVLHFCL